MGDLKVDIEKKKFFVSEINFKNDTISKSIFIILRISRFWLENSILGQILGLQNFVFLCFGSTLD